MSALDPLLSALAGKSPDVRADFVGHLAFNVVDTIDVAALPADMRADLHRFIERAGFAAADTAAETRARIDAHLQAHPLDEELVRLFGALDAAITFDAAVLVSDQARAASNALGTAQSLEPVGTHGRQPGTLAGGLMGLLASRTGAIARSTPQQPEPTQIPPKPNRNR